MPSIDAENIESWTCLEQIVGPVHSGQRLDNYLGNVVKLNGESFSRAMFQQLVRDQHILVGGQPKKNNYRLRENDCIEIFIPPPEPIELIPEKVLFEIVYEDHDIIVICKPPGLVVHPAAGNMTGTLVHGLLYHCNDLTGINGSLRPGIVHRLDKDTSGLMVVAKNNAAQLSLVKQFKDRRVHKVYHAVVDGILPKKTGTIATLIGRHPVDRKKMAVLSRGGRESVTHWKTIESFDNYSLLEINLETGRTHQIRVHLAHIGLPIVGDSVYGVRKHLSRYREMGVNRQFLHSCKLEFFHPLNNELMEFSAPIYADMSDFLNKLRRETSFV